MPEVPLEGFPQHCGAEGAEDTPCSRVLLRRLPTASSALSKWPRDQCPCAFHMQISCELYIERERLLAEGPGSATGYRSALPGGLIADWSEWPVRAVNADLVLAAVIQQRHELKSPRLEAQLPNLDGWARACEWLKGLREPLPHPERIADELPRFDLPPTLETARALLKTHHGKKAQPTVGFNLTSFCLLSTTGGRASGAIRHTCDFGGDPRWVTSALRREAHSIENEHWKWWKRFVALPASNTPGRPPLIPDLGQWVRDHLDHGKPTRERLDEKAIRARCKRLGVACLDPGDEDRVLKLAAQAIRDEQKRRAQKNSA